MLSWHRPPGNQANFLPWAEQRLEQQRTRKFYWYGFVAGVLVLVLVVFSVLYMNLRQRQFEIQEQINQGSEKLRGLQQSVWLSSLQSRQLAQSNAAVAQQKYRSWRPVKELTRLVETLTLDQQLVSWQWLEESHRQADEQPQVLFEVKGQGSWQLWWSSLLAQYPRMQLGAFQPSGKYWALKAHYIVPNKQVLQGDREVSVDPNSLQGPFDVLLRPPPLGATPTVKTTDDLISQLSQYQAPVSITQGEGLEAAMHLDASQWASLVPLPSAVGWNLISLSIQHGASDQWQVSMQWLPNKRAPSEGYRRQALNEVEGEAVENNAKASLGHYAQGFQAQVLPAKAQPNVPEFIGYSLRAGASPIAWLKSSVNGQIILAEVDDQIDGWYLIHLSTHQAGFRQGERVQVRKRRCLSGECLNE
ncbi:MAG: hypothetical protein PSN46_05250 [Gammaproteobacteria bacterium]|nr:hypothetical protein [Gammaproteobacteria bacterium]